MPQGTSQAPGSEAGSEDADRTLDLTESSLYKELKNQQEERNEQRTLCEQGEVNPQT